MDLSSECQPITLAVVTQNSRFDGNEPSQTKALEGMVVGKDSPTGTANGTISAVTLGILRVADVHPERSLPVQTGIADFISQSGLLGWSFTQSHFRGSSGTFVSTRFAGGVASG